ncbi:MAG: hypothetical protein SynsKO_09870 [Synoicihabitans sp.]
MQLVAPLKCISWSRGLVLAATTSFMVSVAQAQILLKFVYNSGTDTTTATYSGSWGDYTDAEAVINSTAMSISASSFTSYGGSRGFDGTDNTSFHGLTMPWNLETATGRTGDTFGFSSGASSGFLFAEPGYTQGTSIDGSLIFSGSDLTELGFDETEIANGGTLGSGSNLVTWSASVAAVPEPASFGALIGLIVLVFSAFGRRRDVRSPSN